VTGELPVAVAAIVTCFATRPEVAAIALGGSRTSSHIDAASDYDLYVYLDGEIPLDVRRELAARFDSDAEIGNAWFGPGDEWADQSSAVSIDLMYWERAGFERQLCDVIEGYHPSIGYSTAFWHTVRHSIPIFDRDGWFAGLLTLAATPYPEPLRRAIVAFNHPLLRATTSSYRHQIELAIARDDPVSVQHRLTALLASVFDIVFAVNQTLHPGEKRLLEHIEGLEHGAHLGPRIRALIRASTDPVRGDLLPAIEALRDDLDATIRDAGLANVIDTPGTRHSPDPGV
jgi:predicted nucleotidyltransferase